MLNSHFNQIFVINLARRQDRWTHCLAQFEKFSFTATRFDAHDQVLDEGRVSGNKGCTASHRGILELIAHFRWPKTLVLEDDFQILHPDFNVRFDKAWPLVPADWDIVYLGGHYADAPIARVNPSIIRCGRMHTTSSYAITYEAARRMAPHISGVGPIDVLYSGFAETGKHYILQPRLMIQSQGYSDIQEQETKNEWAMLDERHEKMV